MNKYYTFCLFLVLSQFSIGQEGYFGFDSDAEAFGFQTVEQIKETCLSNNVDESSRSFQIVSRILKQMGLYDLQFKMSECPNIKNARAQLVPNDAGVKEHFIVYDKEWLNQLSSNTTNWAAIGVLAHEIAHFQLDHEVRGGGSRPDWELEADKFLGFQLAKMGASLSQAQSCFAKASIKGTRTHPPKAERLEAVEIGWSRFRLESANQLTEDTRLRDVTPQLILDRYSKELGGYKVLNTVSGIAYDVQIEEKHTLSNYKTSSYTYMQQMDLTPSEYTIIDGDQDEKFRVVTTSGISGDSLFYKRPIKSNSWSLGAPPNGTGNILTVEDHQFIASRQPRLMAFFEHLKLTSKPDRAQFNYLRVPFNQQECYVLELPEVIIEKGSKDKSWFRATITTKNYYSTITGLLVGMIEEEKIHYFKKEKPIIKKDKEFVRETVFSEYQQFNQQLLPSKINTVIQERNNRGVLQEEGKMEQTRTLTNVSIR